MGSASVAPPTDPVSRAPTGTPPPGKGPAVTGADEAPERFLPLTPATFQLLLGLTKGPLHGYGLKRDVEERTGGRIRLGAGTLYAGLQRMEGEDLVVEVEPPDEKEAVASSRWRFYDITPLGRRVLEAELRRLEEDVRAARALLSGEGAV